VVGTARNVERSNQRKVTVASRVTREIPGIRATDIDLVTYCPKCKRPLCFMESKSWEVGDGHWDQCRRHARFYGHGCIALLIIEKDPVGIKLYDSSRNVIHETVWGGEEYLAEVLQKARDIHVCW
jgi:hypothetical protein